MKLIVGLGNPGPKYDNTRHNAGFIVLDQLAAKASATFSADNRFQAEVARGRLYGQECLFVKPMSYMNLSGGPVSQIMRYFKLDISDLVVLNDDIDVPYGKVKLKRNGGHGGHNGLRDIIAKTGSSEFIRVKLGVGRPADDRHAVSDWVLGKFTVDELVVIEQQMPEEVSVRLKNIW